MAFSVPTLAWYLWISIFTNLTLASNEKTYPPVRYLTHDTGFAMANLVQRGPGTLSSLIMKASCLAHDDKDNTLYSYEGHQQRSCTKLPKPKDQNPADSQLGVWYYSLMALGDCIWNRYDGMNEFYYARGRDLPDRNQESLNLSEDYKACTVIFCWAPGHVVYLCNNRPVGEDGTREPVTVNKREVAKIIYNMGEFLFMDKAWVNYERNETMTYSDSGTKVRVPRPCSTLEKDASEDSNLDNLDYFAKSGWVQPLESEPKWWIEVKREVGGGDGRVMGCRKWEAVGVESGDLSGTTGFDKSSIYTPRESAIGAATEANRCWVAQQQSSWCIPCHQMY